jgi:hypothetical protein
MKVEVCLTLVRTIELDIDRDSYEDRIDFESAVITGTEAFLRPENFDINRDGSEYVLYDADEGDMIEGLGFIANEEGGTPWIRKSF